VYHENEFLRHIGVPEKEYAVKVGDLQRVRITPGQSVARPEATRATENSREVSSTHTYYGTSRKTPRFSD